MLFKTHVYEHDNDGCCYVFVLCINLVMPVDILSVKFVYNLRFYSTKLFSCEHHYIFTKYNLFNNNSNLFAVTRLKKAGNSASTSLFLSLEYYVN